MGDVRLRWLTREKSTAEPVKPAGERRVPAWLEQLAQLLQRTAPESVDWQSILTLVEQATGADLVRIWRVVPARELRLVAVRGQTGAPTASRPIPPGFEQVLADQHVVGAPARLGSSPLLSLQDLEELRQEGIAQLLVVPLAFGGQVCGRLEIGRRRAEPFGDAERAATAVLAPLLASFLAASGPRLWERQPVSTLLAGALATVSSAREALARLLDAVRWRARADVALLVRWSDDERPELVITTGDASLLPDPAAFATARVASVLRAVLEQGRSEEWRNGAGIELLFPRDVASVLAVPLPVVVERTRGLVLVAWRTESPDGVAEAKRSLEELSAAIVSLLAWLSAEESAAATRDRVRWLENVLATFAAVSDAQALSTVLWHLLSRDGDVALVAVLLQDRDQLVWFGTAAGNPLPARRAPLAQLPFAAVWQGGQPVRLGPAQREEWRALLPDDLPVRSLLVVPVQPATVALAVGSTKDEPSAAVERALRHLAGVLAPSAGALLGRSRRLTLPDRREQALLDALRADERERRQLVETIHTAVLQGLATTLYRIELTVRRADQQPIEQTVLELEQVRDRLAEQIATLRDTIFRLRPASLEHLGLVAALRDFLTQLERTRGISVEFLGELPARLDPELEEKLYRIAQTLIEQARLPAGVTRLVVRLRQRRDGAILLVIADDGKWEGDEVWAQQPGVALAEEWIRLLGGSLQATGLPDGGTAVALTVGAGGATLGAQVPNRTKR